jgi:hypothetical protein
MRDPSVRASMPVALAALLVLGTALTQAQPAGTPAPAPSSARFSFPFELTAAAPSFSRVFRAVRDGNHAVGVDLEAPGAVTLRVTARDMDPLEEVSKAPLGVQFEATRGLPYTITVSLQPPLAGPAKGQLTVLYGPGEPFSKRPLNPHEPLTRSSLAPVHKTRDPLFPIVAQLAARHLAGASDKNELDLAFDQMLTEDPDIEQGALQQIVDVFQAIPAAERDKRYVMPLPGQPLAPIGREQVLRCFTAADPRLGQALADAPREGQGRRPRLCLLQAPASEAGYEGGEEVALSGVAFSPVPEENQIELWPSDPLAKAPDYTLTPSAATPNLLRFTLPEGLKADNWRLSVITGTLRTNQIALGVGSSARDSKATAPAITSLAMDTRGGLFLDIQGQNFASTPGAMVRIRTEDSLAPIDIQLPVEMLTDLTGRVDLSEFLDLRGRALWLEMMGKTRPVVHHLYLPGAPRFRIGFDRVLCKDESDPEKASIWPCHDEAVTFWVAGTDYDLWAKNTGVYSGFDDGDAQDYEEDSPVLDPWGGWAYSNNVVYLGTTLYEWDEGDVHAAQGVVKAVGWIAGKIIDLYAPGVGSVVDQLIGGLAMVMGDLAYHWGGAPDMLGECMEVWTVPELEQMIPVNPARGDVGRVTRVLNFDNSDRTGSYQLTYHIDRWEGTVPAPGE